ncbi:MAG: 2-oxoglutarate dehydrogenase E1 component [Saprospiraceae bacterium]|nr:2-oxoglutarate dehydrogenase E1 component [Saprospiraceae bacterium]
MKDFSYIFNAPAEYIDKLYHQYLADPESIEAGWRTFFQGFEFGQQVNGDGVSAGQATDADTRKEFNVLSLIHGFRTRGHLLSTTNPIRTRRDRRPHLNLNDYYLSDDDLDRRFTAGWTIGLEDATLRDIIDRLKTIYCGNIGFEFAHIENNEKRKWLREKIEKRPLEPDYGLDIETKRRILEKLNGAVVFEKFLHTKYVGQKRFSLEGGETTIAALDEMISTASRAGVEEFIVGMAHRGRLNVLANTMGKTYEQIFNEFEGTSIPDLSFGDGDVKYHLGFSSQIEATTGKTVHLKLVPNPSHLESVDPVVEGFARAKADILYDRDYDRIMPILIHGDAAIAAQGVVYEVVQMSQLDGYYTGGTIHFVINNQIGFTTDFDDARSSTYCTGVASLIQAPVFHVNGDDPEAVVFATRLAVEYRQKFNNDVFIDMVCYRRHGHNEGDDPKFTQPEMYRIIQNHPNPREIYVGRLAARGDVERSLAEDMETNFWSELQRRLDMVKEKPLPYEYQESEQAWRQLKKNVTAEDFETSPDTGIPAEQRDHILQHLVTVPDGFTPLGKFNRLLKGMHGLLDESKLDWAMAELLAYGSILMDGKDVRMSGQDVKRGTFSHRHAILYDAKSYQAYNRLSGLSEQQGRFMIYNSLLSEFGVLGFEYGYSLATPDSLVIWEAQFGDFYNGAQTIVDQYISAAESKWRRMSGLVMLLPHGYAGQGPEHSSARLERFLQQCAEFNLTVVNLTTPANFFHVLRRQLIRPFRKPLIVMSPKSLLRHPLCVSSFEVFEDGQTFNEYYDDPEVGEKTGSLRKVLLCSGKVYYDLLKTKKKDGHDDVAIVRIEQLYPIPKRVLQTLEDRYGQARVVWVQEEPENMGAWTYIRGLLPFQDLQVVARKASASPATGFKKVHDKQQADLIERAFA